MYVALATRIYRDGAEHLLYVLSAAGEGRFLAKLTQYALAHGESSQLVNAVYAGEVPATKRPLSGCCV